MRPRVRMVALAVVSGLVPVSCGGEGDKPASPQLAHAAERTLDGGGARFTSRSFGALIDWSYRIRERGIVDAEGSTDLVYTAITHTRGSAPRTGEARQVVIADTSYVRTLPKGSWTRMGAPQAPFKTSDLLGTGPEALDDLAFLRDVRRVRNEEVRGVRTIHYTAETPLHRLAEVAVPSDRKEARREMRRLIGLKAKGSGLRTDVWLDGQGRVRRIRERLSLRLPGYDRRADRATTDFFGFGPRPRINAPPNATKGLSALVE